MRGTKERVIAMLVVVCVLAAAFFLPGMGQEEDKTANTAGDQEISSDRQETENTGEEKTEGDTAENSGVDQNQLAEKEEETPVEEQPQEPEVEEPVEETPTEEEPVAPAEEPAVPTCTLSVTCAVILDNMDKLTPGKETLVPDDGWLLAPMEIQLQSGDTAFSILQRELQSRNMHIEYSTAALYDTAYVEGICNLYEYDCGELSGWEYAVNGTFYSYGSSQFTLNDGDEVIWAYTCDLGADLGDPSAQ